MVDPFGRRVSYLRVSVTDRCDLRCVYCMAEEMTFLPKADLLTLEELDRICGAFIDKGLRKIRITGGEPLVRRGIMTLFRSLGRRLGEGLDELTVTTNATQLAKVAGELHDSGASTFRSTPSIRRNSRRSRAGAISIRSWAASPRPRPRVSRSRSTRSRSRTPTSTSTTA
jgi:MoaA/NifB/PqqE/SkfB family radical SAM enzyme